MTKSSSLEQSGATMPDGFDLLHPVSEPFLERVSRDQRITRDHPRKRQEEKSERSHEGNASEEDSPNETGGSETPMSSNHIDLRI